MKKKDGKNEGRENKTKVCASKLFANSSFLQKVGREATDLNTTIKAVLVSTSHPPSVAVLFVIVLDTIRYTYSGYIYERWWWCVVKEIDDDPSPHKLHRRTGYVAPLSGDVITEQASQTMTMTKYYYNRSESCAKIK